MYTLSKLLPNELMATDVYIAISSDEVDENEIGKDVDICLTMLKDFEKRYSRFSKFNELSELNAGENVTVSNELINILSICKEYYLKTEGHFDPTIHNALVNNGYVLSKNQGYTDKVHTAITNDVSNNFTFEDVKIDTKLKTVSKPKNLKVDLGGIGKGYIIDKISQTLFAKYTDYAISVGGDMYLKGKDQINNYNFWAIHIENPFTNNPDFSNNLPTLIVSNSAIATSGVNKRIWEKEGKAHNHLVNPFTKESVKTDILCATVISSTTTNADIMAKYLVLMGSSKGEKYCEENDIAAVFIKKDESIYLTNEIKKYVWNE